MRKILVAGKTEDGRPDAEGAVVTAYANAVLRALGWTPPPEQRREDA